MKWIVVKAEFGIAVCMVDDEESELLVQREGWRIVKEPSTLREASLFCTGWNLGIDKS